MLQFVSVAARTDKGVHRTVLVMSEAYLMSDRSFQLCCSFPYCLAPFACSRSSGRLSKKCGPPRIGHAGPPPRDMLSSLV